MPFASRSRAFKRLAASREGTCRGRLVSWRRVTASASASSSPKYPPANSRAAWSSTATMELPRSSPTASVRRRSWSRSSWVQVWTRSQPVFVELDQADPAVSWVASALYQTELEQLVRHEVCGLGADESTSAQLGVGERQPLSQDLENEELGQRSPWESDKFSVNRSRARPRR